MADKSELRRSLSAQRKALDAASWSARSARVQQHLLADPLFREARCVALYRAFGNEVDTAALHEAALEAGQRLAYPELVSEGQPMRFVEARRHAIWRLGPRGFEAPDGPVVPLEEIALFVLPGLGFDRAGRRLGRGAGHYDRTLGLPLRARGVGLAFDFQLVDSLPEDPWDVRLDAVATESGMVRASEAARG